MIADTNILLRTIDGPDHPLNPRAVELVRKALAMGEQVRVLVATAHEVAYVLTSKAAGYGLSPSLVAATMIELLDAPELTFQEPDIIRTAATLHGRTGIDFHDCYLTAVEHLAGDTVLTLDSDIDILRGQLG